MHSSELPIDVWASIKAADGHTPSMDARVLTDDYQKVVRSAGQGTREAFVFFPKKRHFRYRGSACEAWLTGSGPDSVGYVGQNGDDWIAFHVPCDPSSFALCDVASKAFQRRVIRVNRCMRAERAKPGAWPFPAFFDAQQHIIIMPYVACMPPSMHSVGLVGAEPPVQYKYMMHALGLAGAEPRRPVTRHPAVLEGPLDDAHLPPATYTKKAGAKADDVRSGSGVPSWFLAEALDLA